VSEVSGWSVGVYGLGCENDKRRKGVNEGTMLMVWLFRSLMDWNGLVTCKL
jgi:hypothetical protein